MEKTFAIPKKLIFAVGGLACLGIAFYFVSSALYLFNPKEQKTSYEKIDYQSVSQKDEKLPMGVSVLTQTGIEGQREIVTEYIYDKNGAVVKSKKISEKVTQEPTEKITLEGSASKDDLITFAKEATDAFLTLWKEENWSQIKEKATNLGNYSDNNLSEVAKVLDFKINSFQVNEPTVDFSDGSFTISNPPEITAKVPVLITVTDKIKSQYNKTVEIPAEYDYDQTQWKMAFPGPLKYADISQAQDFPSGNYEKEAGGKVTIEKIITWSDIWQDSNYNQPFLLIILSGKFSDDTPIKYVNFYTVKDDLGSSYSFPDKYGETINWGGEASEIKVLKTVQSRSYSTDSEIPNSLSIVVDSISSEPYESSETPKYKNYLSNDLQFLGLKL